MTLSKADLYRIAVAPRPLPDNFVQSLRYWLHRDATLVPIPGTDNVRTDRFTTALRAVISVLGEARDIAHASQELGHEDTNSDAPNDSFRAGMHSGQNHQSIYLHSMTLRAMAQELYRDEVPEEERTL